MYNTIILPTLSFSFSLSAERLRHCGIIRYKMCIFRFLMRSLIDSILGATLQFSGREVKTGKIVNDPGQGVEKITGPDRNILTNSMVNVASATLTALALSIIAQTTSLSSLLFRT